MNALARRLGCTEGQAYTAVIGVTIAMVAALIGLPPTLRTGGLPALGSASAGELAEAPSPPANTDTPIADVPAAPPIDVPAGGADLSTGGPAAPSSPVRSPPTATATGPAAPPPGEAEGAPTGFGTARLLARVGSPGAPDGVAVDDDGRVLVTTNNGLLRGDPGPSKVLRYGQDGELQAELAIAGQDPARTGGLTGVAVAGDGTVLVLDTAPARLLRVDLDRATQETVAVLPDIPADGPPQPAALALDDDGSAYVADAGQGVIWRVPPGGEPVSWYAFADADVASGPTGVVFDRAGDLLVVTAVALQGSPAEGLVERIDVRPDGSAGTRTTFATTEPLSRPATLALTDGGAIVITLHVANEVLLLGAGGEEQARLTAEQVEETAGVPLDGPVGIAVHDGAVVVTNQSATDDAAHWAVLVVDLI